MCVEEGVQRVSASQLKVQVVGRWVGSQGLVVQQFYGLEADTVSEPVGLSPDAPIPPARISLTFKIIMTIGDRPEICSGPSVLEVLGDRCSFTQCHLTV